MFVQNKYTSWYFSLVEKRKSVQRSELYTERHHIIPKSMGGGNEKDNLVRLTPREHFVAHWLLTKMCESETHKTKMEYAIQRMMKNNDITHKHEWAKWQYEIASQKKVEALRKNRENGNCPRTGKKHSEESKKKMSIARLGKKFDPEKLKLRKPRVVTEETRKKLSASLTGRIFSEESRQKSSLTQKGRPAERVECPHCGKIGGKPIMKRYHFNNCRNA